MVPTEESREGRHEDSETAQGPRDDASEKVRGELEKLQEGPSFSILGAELPVRVLLASGIFLVAFMLVYMLMWAALGGLGLALGWIVAAAAGAAAVKLYADRASD